MAPTDRTPTHGGTGGHDRAHLDSRQSADAHDLYHEGYGHKPHDGLYNEEVAHEHSDVNVRALLLSAVGLLVVTAVVHLSMWGLFKVFEKQAAENDPALSPLAVPAGQPPPEPRLLHDEPLNLKNIKTEEAQVLEGYGWIDQAAGIARVPIEDAKKKLLHDGLPVRPNAPADPSLGTWGPARGESSSGRAIQLRPGVPGPQQPATPAAGQPVQPPAAQKDPHKDGH